MIMRNPTKYDDPSVSRYSWKPDRTHNIPEPILSYRLACVAISCMRYLHRQDPSTPPMQGQLVAWAMKSKRSPWLWRQRMRFISMARRQLICNKNGPKCSFPQSFQGSCQILHSKRINSELFHLEQCTLYIWTLDLLYYTLLKAMKYDELTRALSKPFIPPSVVLLFPRRIQRVRKAVDAYLEKVSSRICYLRTCDDVPLCWQFSTSGLYTLNVEVAVRRSMRRLPQSFLVTFNDNNPESSRKVSEIPLDTNTKLKHNSIFN